MGLFNMFRQKPNPDVLSQEEEMSLELFLQLIKQTQSKKQPDYEDKVKRLAAAIYVHSFTRLGKRLIPLESIANPMNVLENPKLVRYSGFYRGIHESLNSILGNNIFKSIPPISQTLKPALIELLKQSSAQLRKI